jgi:hypothetical protein
VTNETVIAMKRTSKAAEAALPGCGAARFWPAEFPALGQFGQPSASPVNSRRNHWATSRRDGLADTPWCDRVHRERVGDRQAEQLRERPRARSDLHHNSSLVRVCCQRLLTKPAFEVVEQLVLSPSVARTAARPFRRQLRFQASINRAFVQHCRFSS